MSVDETGGVSSCGETFVRVKTGPHVEDTLQLFRVVIYVSWLLHGCLLFSKILHIHHRRQSVN